MSPPSETTTESGPAPSRLALTQFVLLAIWPDQHHTLFKLPSSGEVTIGRAKSCDIEIDHTRISRKHVTLDVGSTLVLEDLGSKNGTRFRGQPLPPLTPVELLPGDSFEIGDVVLLLQSRPAPQQGSEVATTGPMNDLLMLARRVAAGSLSVLLLGETGVGKEVLARNLHQWSRRADQPFLRLNCAAFTEALIESELFGHEKGAFTGAASAKNGLLETAHSGTVFFDEVGELPLATQAKLLRVIEHREFIRVGGVRAKSIDVRFLSATNRDLEKEVAAGRFRKDLYFRLAGAVLEIPPLRERRDEILPLAVQFLTEAGEADELRVPPLDPASVSLLHAHQWPGNIRELRHAMQRAILVCGDASTILPEHLGAIGPVPEVVDEPRAGAVASPAVSDRDLIVETLARFAGNQSQAARHLGMSRGALIARVAKYGLGRPRKRS